MIRFCGISAVVILLQLGHIQAQTQLETDELTLKNSKIPTDAQSLIQFFQRRSLKEGDSKVLEDLVLKLGSEVYRIREPAAKELVTSGPMALPFLKSALKNSPLEMKRRAEQCIRDIESTMQSDVIAAAVRVLAQTKAPRAAPVLFHFLPSISGDSMLEEEILTNLGRLTIHAGKVDPLILQALKDPLPFRRAVAVYLIGRRGDPAHRQTLRQLLADADPAIRQRVGEGLIGKRPGLTLQEAAATDDSLLRSVNIELTDTAILHFFRKRTPSEKDQQRLRAHVKELGNGAYSVRVSATKQLISEGTLALGHLQQAEFDTDVELSRRARFCLDEIRRSSNTAVPMAAVRWLARQAQVSSASPAEAIRVLLAYIPFADDEVVEEEILTGLTLLSLREPALSPELRKALKDPHAARRSAAAYVLGHVGLKADIANVQPLLDDIHPVVRLRAAQGMLAAQDKAGLRCLVQLLQNVPAAYLNRVEETLQRLSDDKGPSETVNATSAESRQKVAKAWEIWLAANQAKIDLANLGERESYLGLITICEYDNRVGNPNGQVWETNKGNQKRWGFSDVMGAMDAHTLPNGRVLVAENNNRRVSERDVNGKIRWEFYVDNTNPICCQRLPNGNTFIASYNMVMEVTPNKALVYRYVPGPQFYIFSAHKARNGNIVAITAQGKIIELDSKTGQHETNSPKLYCSARSPTEKLRVEAPYGSSLGPRDP